MGLIRESSRTTIARMARLGIFRKAFFLILMLFAFSGRAIPITFERQIDLLTTSIGHPFLSDSDLINTVLPSPAVTVANGDLLDFRYSFTNGRLRASDLGLQNDFITGWLSLVNGGTIGNFRINNAILTFENAVTTGGAPTSLSLPSQNSGTLHLGPFFDNFLPNNSSVTFSGMHVTFEASFIPGGQNTYTPWFCLSADKLEVVPAAVNVPEGGHTIVLLAMALLGLAGLSRQMVFPLTKTV